MNKRALCWGGLVLLCVSLTFAVQRVKEKDLGKKYRDFLDLTSYIMLEQEKDVFLQLASDRERDIFIEAFWKQRDPTPGTPQNEYMEEIIDRFNTANTRYGRQAARDGWRTDQGRFYIILGPPVSIDRYDHPGVIYPAEIWSYYGDPDKGLPSHFSLVFFRKGGAGEYKLYDPVADGPDSLLIGGSQMDTTNYLELFEKIREVAPVLALASLSMIPGDIPFNYQPSAQNAIILADILQSPKKDVSPAYATHFLNYKGVVSTEYMTNFVESEARSALIQDPLTGLRFLHFSVAPKSLSIDYYEPNDQYFCNFTMNVSLRRGEEVIFQYSRDYPFYFPAADLDKIRSNGLAIEDSFPVVGGDYQLTVLLQNSVGKEFTVFEQAIAVPGERGGPRLDGPVLGYRFQSYRSDAHIPFKVADQKLILDPKNTFGRTDTLAVLFNVSGLDEDLWKRGQVRVLIQGLRETNPDQKSFGIRLDSYPYKPVINVTQTLPASELSPDYYVLTLSLVDATGGVLDESKTEFIVSPAEALSHPVTHSKAFSLANSFLYYGMLAGQYEKIQDYEKAEALYQKAFEMNPDYKQGAVEYASFLLKAGKNEACLELVESFREVESLRFAYYSIKGKAYMGLGRYEEAIQSLLEGNKIYDSDTGLLNALGYCFYKTDQKDRALEALKVSLRLNPGQENIRDLVAQIEKNR